MNNNLILIYVHSIGEEWQGDNIYEFIFSDKTEDVEGEDWDIYPASIGNVTPPPQDVVRLVGVLRSDDVTLDVISNSDTFSVWDALDGVVALAYENLDDIDEYPDNRLVFRVGDTLEKINDNLLTRGLILKIKE